MGITRRNFSKLIIKTSSVGLFLQTTNVIAQNESVISKAIEIEASLGARLGLSVRDAGSGQTWN